MAPVAAVFAASIREALVGDDAVVPGPYGARRLVYADYAASGRALSFVEDFVQGEVLPFYANTHTEASWTGRRTSELRERARHVIHAAVGGGAEDLVLFCGSGSTAAIDKVIAVLGLRVPSELDARHAVSSRIPEAERPVVFIGPHEHHSNELPWRESLATVVAIPEDGEGRLDLGALERELVRYAARSLKIGSFSAGSNVTGAISDTLRVSELLHRHGALAFWDYAAAGPYLPIQMNPESPRAPRELLQKDAVFLSPHKFAGGPGACGVLVIKRRLLQSRVPSVPGGGTISYVNAGVHHYTPDPIQREEGGTPNILGSIRAGLAFEIKQAAGRAALEHEQSLVRRALESLSTNPKLVVLGDARAARLPILSFVVKYRDRLLHHQFVATLLSDLFGIQARGGCSCAGPYGHALLGVDASASQGFEQQVLRGRLGIKPGWTRINFSYFFSETVFDYILRALHFVATHGARFLADYDFVPETGEWLHVARKRADSPWLELGPSLASRARASVPRATASESELEGYLQQASALLLRRRTPSARSARPLPADFEEFRWFALAGEVQGTFATAEAGQSLQGARLIQPRAVPRFTAQ